MRPSGGRFPEERWPCYPSCLPLSKHLSWVWEFMTLSSVYAGILTGFILCRSCVDIYSCCKFMSIMALACPENTFLAIFLYLWLLKSCSQEYKSQRWWRHQENKYLQINMSKAPMNSQRPKQHTQGPHRSSSGPLCIYHSFQVSVFMEFLNM